MKELADFRAQPISRAVFVLAIALAVLAGLYGRFRGLATWPLGVDEYYISRSIDNVLRVGLPQFSCGGYYTRGLAYQYLVAALRMSGESAEFAGRVVAAVSSLIVLPAAYRLGRRVAGTLAGWLVVIILCLSIWEIEMARFARMYAPFQAVFAWYLLAYVRFVVDRHSAALGWMAALSVLGVLTWEGGVLLGIANLLAVVLMHDHGRLRVVDWKRLVMLLVLLVLLYLATRDLRGYADLPDAVDTDEAPARLEWLGGWLLPLRTHPLAACGLLVPLACATASAAFVASYRRHWLAAVGLTIAILAALVHRFTVSGGMVVLLLCAGLIDWQAIISRRARYFLLTLATSLVFWSAVFHWLPGTGAGTGSGADLAIGGGAGAGHASPLMERLFGFPDVYGEMIRPWARTLPAMTVAIVLAAAYWFWQGVARRRPPPAVGTLTPPATGALMPRAIEALTPPAIEALTLPATGALMPPAIEATGALLALVIAMALAVGSTATDRIETRYTFFLYPLFVVLIVTALLDLIRRFRMLERLPLAAAAAIPLIGFCATEDFQPRHLAQIDSARVNFRVGMSPARTAHYYPRSDVRAVGQWLSANVRHGDIVVTGIPNLAQYYDGFDYFYLGRGDERYESYVCPDGRTERWSGHPVLYSEHAMSSLVKSGRRVFAAVYPETETALRAAAAQEGWSVARVWTSPIDRSGVLLIAAAHAADAG